MTGSEIVWDALPGDGQGAAGADPPFHLHGVRWGLRWWACGSGVTEAAYVCRGERIRQTAQPDAAVRPGESADGVDRPFDLDRAAGPDRARADRRWAGRLSTA